MSSSSGSSADARGGGVSVPPARRGRVGDGGPRRRGRRRRSWAGTAFVAPLVTYLLVFYAYPLAENVSR